MYRDLRNDMVIFFSEISTRSDFEVVFLFMNQKARAIANYTIVACS